MARAKPTPERRTPIKILIVDDHPMLRRGLAALIGTEPDFAVCGEAGGCASALTAIRCTMPDLVIVDLALDEGDGLDLLKSMKRDHPEIPALVLTSHDEAIFAERVFRAGARGFVAKHEMGDTVLVAIRRVLEGWRYMSPRTSERFVGHFLDAKAEHEDSPLDALSDRELQVFRLIGGGGKSREIARTLRVSVKTIESHRARMRVKLKLDSGAALNLMAAGWVGSGLGPR